MRLAIVCLLALGLVGCGQRESRRRRDDGDDRVRATAVSSDVKSALRRETAATRAEYAATWLALAEFVEKTDTLTMPDAVRAITRTVESHPVLPEVPALKPVGESALGGFLDADKEPKDWRGDMVRILREMAEGAK